MSQQSPSENKQDRVTVGEILNHLWHVTKKNWGFKLLALLIAIALWAGLITQDPTLTREKIFTGVSVTVSGADTLKRNGFIVTSDLEDVLSGVQMKADVPQMQYQDATAANYNVRIDLSRIRETGTQRVRLSTTNSSTYGSVTEIVPESVEVTVEEYVTRYRIPVALQVIGEAPEGYYAATPNLDPPLVAVSGPKSLVDQIARAEAVLDLSTLPAREGLIRTTVPFTLLDSDGNVVESSLLEVTSESVLLDSVIVEQQLYPKRTLSLSGTGIITGTPADGYEVKSVTITPSVITVAGSSASLDLVDTIYPDASVSVAGAMASFTQQVKVRKTSEMSYISNDSVTVEVEIGPAITSRTLKNIRVSLTNVGSGLNAVLSTAQANVTITGPQLVVENLWNSSVTLTCDASGLTAGVYELPVSCTLSGDEDGECTVETDPAKVTVTLTQR